MCETAEARVRELAGSHQEVVVHDLSADRNAAAVDRAEEYGVNVVPAIVVDGRLLGCCRTPGVDPHQLVAAGVGRPHG